MTKTLSLHEVMQALYSSAHTVLLQCAKCNRFFDTLHIGHDGIGRCEKCCKNGIDARLAEALEPRPEVFWGEEHHVVPMPVDTVIGDGERLLWFTPWATRPNYYVIRVDSDMDADDTEEIDTVITAIEGEYGCADDGYEDGEGEPLPWPALDLSCGYSWSIEEEV
jgi:hypothetical protein